MSETGILLHPAQLCAIPLLLKSDKWLRIYLLMGIILTEILSAFKLISKPPGYRKKHSYLVDEYQQIEPRWQSHLEIDLLGQGHSAGNICVLWNSR